MENGVLCVTIGQSELPNPGPKDDKYIRFYKVVKDYLAEIDPSAIDVNKYFINADSPYKNMKEILYIFILSMQDYQFLPNVIGLMKPERAPIFKRILFDYDYSEILKAYNAEALYKTFAIISTLIIKKAKVILGEGMQIL